MGANGSGKTSLVTALAGFTTPTDGEMTVLGQTYGQSDWRDLRRHIGLVSPAIERKVDGEETALEIVASGLYNQINFWGKLTAADKKKSLDVLRQVELETLAKREWSVLSQGERQRVLIGRALISNPKLLILDEPCAGLDPAARENFLAFLERLSAQKTSPSLVLVTHHVEEILPIFTHALILKSGEVLASGRVKDALTADVLSRAFGARIAIGNESGRYRLQIRPRKNLVI